MCPKSYFKFNLFNFLFLGGWVVSTIATFGDWRRDSDLGGEDRPGIRNYWEETPSTPEGGATWKNCDRPGHRQTVEVRAWA